MGYYSEVALAITSDAFNKITTDVKCNGAHYDASPIRDLLDGSDIQRHDNEHRLYVWECEKWYGKDIDLFMLALSKLDEDDYHFLEIGESHDHINELGSLNDNFNIGYFTKLSFDD